MPVQDIRVGVVLTLMVLVLSVGVVAHGQHWLWGGGADSGCAGCWQEDDAVLAQASADAEMMGE